MPQEQTRTYDTNAESLSLQWAAETGPASYQNRLEGIQRDKLSFQNELADEYAYWSGSYELGVDSHGAAALVTPEIAIPGRIHRSDSHAMVDSMAGYAVYVLDQIEKGAMPHEEWDTAREQIKQFQAVQEEVLKLQDGQSLLGFGMNGCKTNDGISLMQITRHDQSFIYETRLIGGLSEGAARDVLLTFTSDTATLHFLKEQKENPLYAVVKGTIDVDLHNQRKILTVVQNVLDARNEERTDIVPFRSCRTTESPKEKSENKSKKTDLSIVARQQEYVFGFMKKNRIEEKSSVSVQSDTRVNLAPVEPMPVHSVLLFDYGTQVKQRQGAAEMMEKQKAQFVYAPSYQEVRELIVPEKSLAMGEAAQQTLRQISGMPTEDFALSERTEKTAKSSVKQSQAEMPVATFLVKSDNQAHSVYMEKALSVIIAVDAPLPVGDVKPLGEVMHEHMVVRDQQHTGKHEKESVWQSDVTEVMKTEEKQLVEENGVYVEVDQIQVQDIRVCIEHFEKQIKTGTICGEIKKLVWMETNDQVELVPVEEVEIDKDTTKTMHNLLHFLRKIVHTYVANDVIRERNILRVASDVAPDELEELETYMHVLQASRFRGHMFAMVS